MPSVRDALAPSGRLLRSAAVASVLACSTAGVVLLPAVAAADEPAGRTVVGELVQVWAEGQHADGDHAAEGPLTFVEPTAGDAVRVPTDEVADLPAGATVSVTVGTQVEDEASTEDGLEPAHTVLTSDVLETNPGATLPAAAGHEVTVVLVAPAGSTPDGTELADVVQAVNGPVAGFWAEQSGGAITLGVSEEHGWTTTTAGCSTPTTLWNETAAAVDFVPGDRKHLMLYVTRNAPGCAYALAEVGRSVDAGGRLYVRDTVPSVIAHELGHNFGLGHSSGLQCDGTVEGGSCRTSAYRDYYDVMGVSWERLGSLNAAQAARLKVLPGDAVRTQPAAGASETVTLAPLAGRTGTRALQLTDARGVDYWLEYRTPADRDAWLDAGNRYGLDSGVLLRQAGRTLPDTSLLLDGTPSRAAGWNKDLQAALPVGAAVPVAGGTFSVVVESVNPTGAVVRVSTASGAAPGTPAPAPADIGPGTVMTGSTASATGADGATVQGESIPAGAAPAVAAVSPGAHAVLAAPATDTLEASAGSAPIGGLTVAAAAALLAGAVLLLRRMRRPFSR